MSATTTITYSQGPGVGEGYFSSFAIGQTALVTLMAEKGDVNLVIQRYNDSTISLLVKEGTSYAANVSNIQTVGVLVVNAPRKHKDHDKHKDRHATGTLTVSELEI